MRTIWYISKYVTPADERSGSSGTRAFRIMAEIAKLGHKVVIVTSDSNHFLKPQLLPARYVLQNLKGIQFWWVKTTKYTKTHSLVRVLSWLDFEFRLFLMPKKNIPAPDSIIVSSLSLLTILNGLYLRHIYRCKLVFEIRDIWPLTAVSLGAYSRYNPLILALALIEKMGYRYSDYIVGTMPNLTEHVTNVLGYQRRVSCIPMGVDVELALTPPALSDEYVDAYIPKSKFIFAHVGSVGVSNALEVFFEAAKELEAQSELVFLIVGSGDALAHFQTTYGHLKNVSFAPRVPPEYVLSLLGHCDLLYCSLQPTTLYRFGQSLNKLVDYMAAGKPIIASYDGAPSMINEADCGTFIPASNVHALVSEVLRFSQASPADREEIGARGQRWLFSNRAFPKLAKAYLDILES